MTPEYPGEEATWHFFFQNLWVDSLGAVSSPLMLNTSVLSLIQWDWWYASDRQAQSGIQESVYYSVLKIHKSGTGDRILSHTYKITTDHNGTTNHLPGNASRITDELNLIDVAVSDPSEKSVVRKCCPPCNKPDLVYVCSTTNTIPHAEGETAGSSSNRWSRVQVSAPTSTYAIVCWIAVLLDNRSPNQK